MLSAVVSGGERESVVCGGRGRGAIFGVGWNVAKGEVEVEAMMHGSRNDPKGGRGRGERLNERVY